MSSITKVCNVEKFLTNLKTIRSYSAVKSSGLLSPEFSVYTRCLATWNSFLGRNHVSVCMCVCVMLGENKHRVRKIGRRNPLKSFSRLITHGWRQIGWVSFPFVLLRKTSFHKIPPVKNYIQSRALKNVCNIKLLSMLYFFYKYFLRRSVCWSKSTRRQIWICTTY